MPCMFSDLDFRVKTGHDTPLGHGEQKIIEWSIISSPTSELKWILARPKLKLRLFPQPRPTRENWPDWNNFFAIFFEELFFSGFFGTTVTGL